MSFQPQFSSAPSKPLPQWKQNIVNWIDRNYGTPEQLDALGAQPRMWYQFNWLEIGMTVFLVYSIFHFIGYL